MNNPLVSIIIPTYNRAHIIHETLDSVLSQSYTNWECIVVDDGSTDTTEEVLKSYVKKDARFQYNKRPIDRKKGANACRNYGLDLAKGAYIVFFDSDDVFSETALEKRIDFFKKNALDMIITSMGLFSDIKKLKIDENRFVFNANLEETIDEFIVGDKLPWNIPRVTFKATFIKSKIYFNEEMLRFQDVDFNIRVLKTLSPKYLSIDTTDCYYRSDLESNARYHNTKFIDIFFENFYILYSTIFYFLDNNQKERLQSKIVLKLYVFIKAYYRQKNKSKIIIIIIKLFKKELSMSFSQKATLFGVYILNRYHFEKKGYLKITKKMKKMLDE